MDSRRSLYGLFVIGLSVVLIAAVASGVGLSATEGCETGQETTLCIDELTLSDDELVAGTEGQFSLTVTNYGEDTRTGILRLYTAGPDNETNVYNMQQVTLKPETSKTVTRPINASTPGTHGLRVTLVDPMSGERYDTSEIKTLEVREEPPAELGGPIDKTEIALVALVGSLIGLGVLGYRQLRG